MQRYFTDRTSHAFLEHAPRIIPKVIALRDAFLKRGRPVFYTRHANTRADAGMLGKWWRDIIRRHDPMSEIDPRIMVPNVRVINKTQYDAFYRTRLAAILLHHHVQRLVITGVMTDLCCETTARSAFVRGFAVVLVTDATATQNRTYHEASCLTLSHGFAVTAKTQEVLKWLGK